MLYRIGYIGVLYGISYTKNGQVIMIDINHLVHLQIVLTLNLRTPRPFNPMLLMMKGLFAVRNVSWKNLSVWKFGMKFVSSRPQKLKLKKWALKLELPTWKISNEVGHPHGSWKDDSESLKRFILMVYWIKNGRQNDINPWLVLKCLSLRFDVYDENVKFLDFAKITMIFRLMGISVVFKKIVLATTS